MEYICESCLERAYIAMLPWTAWRDHEKRMALRPWTERITSKAGVSSREHTTDIGDSDIVKIQGRPQFNERGDDFNIDRISCDLRIKFEV